jgi:1,5-anhydro-D-fructose reductase (1,5-anhydro-D-mannitol-forming)
MNSTKTEAPVLGWGLIGASDIAGTRMIPAINAQPGSRVVAVMSSHLERARHYAARYSIPHAYESIEAILADSRVDVVYISTTNEYHKQYTIAAARAGKHVLCEKPLALALEDAREMVVACQVANVVLGTNHHLRNAVTHRTLRRLLAEGVVGQPLAVRVFHAVYLPSRLQGWRLNRPEAGGGAILDITVHDADTLRFVLQDEIVVVTALAGRQGLAANGLEDSVMGVMQSAHGILVQHHDAFTIRHAQTGFEIHGTEGSLYATDVMTQDPIGRVVLRRADQQSTEIDCGEPENLYERSVRLFNAAVRGEGQPAANGEDGVRSLAIALAVRDSTQSGRHERVRLQESPAPDAAS